MKQQITFNQWKEISPVQAGELIEKMELKFNPDGSFTDLPNIGKMIEVLFDNDFGPIITSNDTAFYWTVEPEKKLACWSKYSFESSELADALWEAVKEIL